MKATLSINGKPYAYRFLNSKDKKECCDILVEYSGCKSDKVVGMARSAAEAHGLPPTAPMIGIGALPLNITVKKSPMVCVEYRVYYETIKL